MNSHTDLLIDRSRVRLFPRYVNIHDVTEHTLLHALASKNPVLCPDCLELLDTADASAGGQFEHRCVSCGLVTSQPIAVVFDDDYEPSRFNAIAAGEESAIRKAPDPIDRSRVRLDPPTIDIGEVAEKELAASFELARPALCPRCFRLMDMANVARNWFNHCDRCQTIQFSMGGFGTAPTEEEDAATAAKLGHYEEIQVVNVIWDEDYRNSPQ